MRWGLIPYGIEPEAFKRLSTGNEKAENAPVASGRNRSASIVVWFLPLASTRGRSSTRRTSSPTPSTSPTERWLPSLACGTLGKIPPTGSGCRATPSLAEDAGPRPRARHPTSERLRPLARSSGNGTLPTDLFHPFPTDEMEAVEVYKDVAM